MLGNYLRSVLMFLVSDVLSVSLSQVHVFNAEALYKKGTFYITWGVRCVYKDEYKVFVKYQNIQIICNGVSKAEVLEEKRLHYTLIC